MLEKIMECISLNEQERVLLEQMKTEATPLPYDITHTLVADDSFSWTLLPKLFTQSSFSKSDYSTYTSIGADLQYNEDNNPYVCELNGETFTLGYSGYKNLGKSAYLRDKILTVTRNGVTTKILLKEHI